MVGACTDLKRPLWITALLLVSTLLLVTAGCGASDGSVSARSTSDEVLYQYFVALQAREFAAARALASTGSPAARYVAVEDGIVAATFQGTGRYGVSEVSFEAGQVNTCFPGNSGVAPCARYSTPVLDPSGKLVDFTFSDQSKLSERVLLATPEQQEAFGGVVRVFPFIRMGGTMVIAVEYEAGAEALSIPLSPKVFFTGPDRVQYAPTSAMQPDIYDLQPGNSQTRTFWFNQPQLPGDFQVEVRGGPNETVSMLRFQIKHYS